MTLEQIAEQITARLLGKIGHASTVEIVALIADELRGQELLHLGQVAEAMGYPVEMAHSPGAVVEHVRTMAAALKETQRSLETAQQERDTAKHLADLAVTARDHYDEERRQRYQEMCGWKGRAELAEQERDALRAENTRTLLRSTFRGFIAGENADSRHWRERAEKAEAQLATVQADTLKEAADAVSTGAPATLFGPLLLPSQMEGVAKWLRARAHAPEPQG